MTSSTPFPFRIVEHLVPGQHIREYPRATSTIQEETLCLSVKQYIPLDNPNPQAGDVTIIGAHANAFPKELYEPLWEDLLARSKANGFRIRAIWIADVAHQGHSSVLNEHALGNDPSWFDHPRDLLHLINLKRAEMPRPIVGIGHSMGGGHLVALSLAHPRLFTSLILLDPAIHNLKSYTDTNTFHSGFNKIPITTLASTYRRDVWPSRTDAADLLGKSKFYQTWDPRVFTRWIQYGLRDLPTAIHSLDPSLETERPVTLTTTHHQEVFTFSRPNYAPNGAPTTRLTHPDQEPNVSSDHRFYRPEPPRIFSLLPYLRPSTLYIFGELSDMSLPEFCQEKLEITGMGAGGSGGVKEGRVDAHVLKQVGHMVPMEAVGLSAELCASWIGKELERWRLEEEAFRMEWDKKSKVEKMTIDDEWKKNIGPPPTRGNGKKQTTGTKL
ncbi:hypothetical protein LOZ66_005185 [Ophidiomyces ophidiicola]|nr:hypothetical protein LOZ66_005185 [Ophidiomyces ophidiicola]